jgi:hypothetical protein
MRILISEVHPSISSSELCSCERTVDFTDCKFRAQVLLVFSDLCKLSGYALMTLLYCLRKTSNYSELD